MEADIVLPDTYGDVSNNVKGSVDLSITFPELDLERLDFQSVTSVRPIGGGDLELHIGHPSRPENRKPLVFFKLENFKKTNFFLSSSTADADLPKYQINPYDLLSGALPTTSTALIDSNLTEIGGSSIKQAIGEVQKNVATADGDILVVDRGIIEGSINTNRLGTSWLEKKRVGNVQFTESGSYKPIAVQVYNSRLSTYQVTQELFYSNDISASLKLPSSSSLKFAEVNNDYGPGYDNLKWNGSKLTGPGVNIDTPNTVDGGPVVKITKVNPNQIVFANNQITTIDESKTGRRKRTI
jgi:hypothetical protein